MPHKTVEKRYKNEVEAEVHEGIQIIYELNEKNRGRRIKGLLNAMDFFGLKDGLIFT